MKKRSLLMAASLVLALLVATTGTLAYLSDTDSDVNVMTLGNVQIEQVEMQRVVENNAWVSTGETDKYGYTPDVLEPFAPGKPLYPAYFADGEIKWDDRVDGHQQSWGQVGAPGSIQLFDDSVKGAQDKFVFVKNTGASDAYVRTWFAFEQGSVTVERFKAIVGTNGDADHWKWETVATDVEIDGNKYVIACATYLGPTSNPNGILAAGATTYPSLLQVYLAPEATNEDVAAIDGNGNGLYDILVFSQAVQTTNFKNAEQALTAAFGTDNPWGANYDVEANSPIIIRTPEDLRTKLTGLTGAGAGDNTVYIASDIDMTGVNWTPIKVNGYQGAGVITIEGNGNTIKGLNAPLFAGGFAGKSGIVIKNLTIADSNIVSTNTLGSGAFIESIDSMPTITLENCHLKNSTVTGGSGSRTGGLIGWTAGYSNVNDGPVKTYVTINNCSVIGNTITCDGSVGGINGHAGNNDWTYTTITNCTVKDNKLNSTDDGEWRVGVVVGTANVGEVTISNITESGNTLTQTGKTAPAGQSNLYGRFVPGTTGKLVINGVEVE